MKNTKKQSLAISSSAINLELLLAEGAPVRLGVGPFVLSVRRPLRVEPARLQQGKGGRRWREREVRVGEREQ